MLCVLLAMAFPLFGQTPRVLNSLLLLIDTSGSMDGEIGSGNSDVKMEAAKAAAIAAVDRALATSATEVAVLGFSGDCTSPVSEHLDFTTDRDRLARFINGLYPDGGTPMAEAVLVANRFMQANGNPGAHSQMIVLLADGDNDCGDVAQAMAELKAAGIVFRHETVGFGIEPTSDAARDLRHVATASGGEYHHAASATQLADVFMEFVDTLTVIDMLGMFGNVASTSTPAGQTSPTSSDRTTSPPAQGAGQDRDTGGVTDMIGMFATEETDEDAAVALAIDADQGSVWGWGAGHPTIAEANRRALDECGEACRVVVSFKDGCGAYAADQTRGSTIRGWGSEFDTANEARSAAMAECGTRGGVHCIVRVWACSDGFGGGQAGTPGGQVPFTAGALAIDAAQGSAWGWAAGYATVADAKRDALEECGDGCRIVMSFEEGCAAYAADQTQDSTARGWASGFDTEPQAKQAALDECEKRGGRDCIVRVWACGG